MEIQKSRGEGVPRIPVPHP